MALSIFLKIGMFTLKNKMAFYFFYLFGLFICNFILLLPYEYDFLKMVIDTSGQAIHSVTLIFVMFSLILCTKNKCCLMGV
ncbi:hypothetical protein BV923_21110 [Pectobacterium odoriferum]|nr:hypothetical protein BV923_21110 [Pectobacterium odoriferum]